jgi:hypothetical protein
MRDELIEIIATVFLKEAIDISSCTLEQAEEVWVLEARHDHLLRKLRELMVRASDRPKDDHVEHRDRALEIWIGMRAMIRKHDQRLIERRQIQQRNSAGNAVGRGDLLLLQQKAKLRREWRKLRKHANGVSGDEHVSDIVTKLVKATVGGASWYVPVLKRYNMGLFNSAFDL